LIVAAGSAHAYFGHSEWQARAPGLKTLDDALHIRRQVLLAFEAAERETDPAAERRLLTFVIVGGGPTGIELDGALAEIARRTLRQDFRHIRPESARIILVEGGPHLLGAFPPRLRDAARRSLEKLGVEIRTGSLVTRVDRSGVTWKDASGKEEHVAAKRSCGRPALPPIAVSLGVPLDRVGRVLAELHSDSGHSGDLRGRRYLR
jgi:NADH dehydrogenase